MKGEPVRVDGGGTRTAGPGATRRARLAFPLWPQTNYVSRFNECGRIDFLMSQGRFLEKQRS